MWILPISYYYNSAKYLVKAPLMKRRNIRLLCKCLMSQILADIKKSDRERALCYDKLRGWLHAICNGPAQIYPGNNGDSKHYRSI